MTPLFSVVLIARNEAKTLPRLIASLKEFQSLGGEVVLVDTGSTDGTPALARSLGCKVFEEGTRFIQTIEAEKAEAINKRFVVSPEEPVVKDSDKLFDYSAARNYAAGLAANDFCAMPDCDEEYTHFDLDTINNAIQSGFGQLEYNFVFAHDEYGAEAVKFMHCKFYDRTKLHWVGIIHEVLAGAAVGTFIAEDKLKLEHWQNPTQDRGGYLTGLALDCFLNPANDRNSHYFGRELMFKGRYRSAIKELLRHIEMNGWQQERAQSMVFLGDCHMAIGQTEEGLSWWHKAFDSDESRREPLMRLASHYYRTGDRQRTAAYASAALTIPWNRFYGNRMEHYTHEPHEMLYWALWESDKAKAKVHWQEAIGYQPLNPKYLNAGQFFLEPPASIEGLTAAIGDNVKFAFVKVGDGEEEAMRGALGQTCDGQKYSKELGLALKESCQAMAGECHIAHHHDQNYVNMLLHRKPNDLQKLKAFWSMIRTMDRPKVFVGPKRLEPIAGLLKSKFIDVPEQNAFSELDRIMAELNGHSKVNQIAMFSCGPTAKVIMGRLWKIPSTTTLIDCGSTFDPICGIESRTEQYSHEELLAIYSDWFDEDEMPPVSICIPTLGRVKQLDRLLSLIPRTACYPRFEIVVERDSFENRRGVAKTLAKAVTRSKHDLVLFLGNDCVPKMGFLREAVKHFKSQFKDGVGLVGLNDGFWTNGELATHWLASKSLLPLIGGEFFHSGYRHVGCDNELTALCKKAGRYSWCKSATIEHATAAQGTAQPDEVSRLAWNPESVECDRALLKQRAEKIGFDLI